MSHYVVCVSLWREDRLIPSLTRPCENTNWQQSSHRVKQRGGDLRSNSIIEIESHLNIGILRAITSHLHLMFSPSPLVSFLAFVSLFLRGELTDTAAQARARRSPYCQKRGGRERRMSSWKNGNEMRKGKSLPPPVRHLFCIEVGNLGRSSLVRLNLFTNSMPDESSLIYWCHIYMSSRTPDRTAASEITGAVPLIHQHVLLVMAAPCRVGIMVVWTTNKPWSDLYF